jgi:hypothetical protein
MDEMGINHGLAAGRPEPQGSARSQRAADVPQARLRRGAALFRVRFSTRQFLRDQPEQDAEFMIGALLKFGRGDDLTHRSSLFCSRGAAHLDLSRGPGTSQSQAERAMGGGCKEKKRNSSRWEKLEKENQPRP